MENWMLIVAGNIATFIATWSVLKYRVSAIEKKQESHDSEDSAYHKEIDRKMDAGFKRLDNMNTSITVLQSETATHLNVESAEKRFVTHRELDLRLKNIELTGKHTDTNVTDLKSEVHEVKGKLDELIQIISHQNTKI